MLPTATRDSETDPTSYTKTVVATLLRTHQTALNASSTFSIPKLSTSDGVSLAQHFSTAVGSEAIAAANDEAFTVTTLSVDFDVIEIVDMSEESAFARTVPAGQPQLKSSGKIGEANQELFVLRTEDWGWEIARDGFCSSLPPH